MGIFSRWLTSQKSNHRHSARRKKQAAFRLSPEFLEERVVMSGAGLLISEFLPNPPGSSDSPFEYVELVATQSINFATTPYSVVFADTSATPTNGWVQGGSVSYGFSITTGSVNPGDVVYVGGSSMVPTGTKLRTINTGTTAGDGFGNAALSGVLGNGGSHADGIAVFDVGIGSLTSSTVPIDAILFGSGLTPGNASINSTTGYQLPVNDRYIGGKVLNSPASFLGADPGSQALIATGIYNASANTFPTPRSWAAGAATATTAISLTPTVTTPTSAAITTTIATLGGNVEYAGSTAVTVRGVVYSKTSDNANPQIGGANVTNMTVSGTTGTFNSNITGLQSGTPYTYAAYATNSIGTAYTAIGTFTTNGLQNSAPVLNGANNFSVISASIADGANTGALVSALIAGRVTDADNGASAGVAITAVDNSNGAWQYSTNGGSNWTAIGTVSNTSALLLASDASSTKIRFVPNVGLTATISITFRAWDQTSGSAGTKVNTSTNGGITAFSSSAANSFITVNAVNSAPLNTVPGPQTFLQDTPRVFSSTLGNAISIADPDAGTNPVQVTLTATNGKATLGGLIGLTFTAGDGTADASMTFTGTMANINSALNGLSFIPTASYSGTASLQIVTNDLGNTGAGGPLTDSDTISLTVVPAVLLNEIKSNPPGQVTGGDKYQYVELRGAAGAALTNIYFVQLDGNGSNVGIADFVVNLTSSSLGSNGLLMIKSPTGGYTPPGNTTVVTDSQFDEVGGALSKHTTSFYLVYSTTAINESTDFDTNNDGVLDGVLATALRLDNVGWSDGDIGDVVYGGVVLTQSQGTPDAASRFLSNTTASTAVAWYNGDLYDLNGPGGNGDPAELLYDATRRSANMPLVPYVPTITPGAVNFNEPPVVTPTTNPLYYTGRGVAKKIDPTILVTDADNATLQSATVTISSGYSNGQDTLTFTNTATITGIFNASSGTLTLTGNDTVANYRAALRSVNFSNPSDNSVVTNRTATFVVNDGAVSSSVATRTIVLLNPPVISEFLASNQSGLLDEDGDSGDWIEIYNPSTTPIDLYNWALTDSNGDLNKWRFPHITLGALQFLVIFADGKNRTGSTLHTNFSLSAGGEYLAMVDPNNSPVSEYTPKFPTQVGNVSYGVEFNTANLINTGANAQILIPTNGSLGNTWTAPSFVPTGWTTGPTGVGFGIVQSGFNVTYIKSNISIPNLTTALQVIANPSYQVNVVNTTAAVINYMGTGGGGNFPNDSLFPTQAQASDDIDLFLIQATGKVAIPTSGLWSFRVNSDDGFQLTLERNGVTFTSSHPGLRGASNTTATFNIPANQVGDWNLTLVVFENSGGSSAELSAAPPGSSTFRLIGDIASGGLSVYSQLGGGNSVIVGTNVASTMQNINSTAYVRIPFTVANPAEFDEFHLEMRYDDGFVAYLNGVEVVRRNAPTTLAHNSTALSDRSISDAIAPEQFDLTPFLYLLQTGNNVLAIQGLNSSASDASFLLLPKLTASSLLTEQPRYFQTPTPGAANGAPSLGIVEKVSASVAAGFYTSSFAVTLATSTPGATIRYTRDGSAPTETNGIAYSVPLAVSVTTTLRAQAFKSSYISLPSVTWTYLFLDDVILQSPSDDVTGGYPDTGVAPAGWPTSWGSNTVDYGMDQTIVTQEGAAQVKAALLALPTLSLTTDLANLFDPTTGIYANAGNDGRDWERPSSVEWLNPDGSPGFQIDAGLRIRGGFSRSAGNPKHSFRLFFRSDYGTSSLDYPIFGDTQGAATSFKKFDLRTAQNYSWSFGGDAGMTMIQDGFARASQLAMGQPSTHSRWVNLYLNGQYWGLFQIEERPESDFAATYLGGVDSNYDVIKVDTNAGYTIFASDGSTAAYQRLWAAVTSTNPADSLAINANYYRLQGKNANGVDDPSIPNADVLVDVDNLIVYMMGILHGGNLDAPISAFLGNAGVNNFFAIRDQTGRAGFTYIQHDAEHTLLNAGENRNGPFNTGGVNNFARFNPQFLHQQLMANADYRQRFGDLIQKFFFNDGPMTVANAQARYQQDVDALNTAIIAESARWGDAQRPTSPLMRSNWLSAVSYQRDNFLVNRNSVFVQQEQTAGLYPTIATPQYLVNGSPMNSGHISLGSLLTFAATGGLMYFTTDGSDPRQVGGGINPAALVYDPNQGNPALVLNGSLQLAARAYNGTAWSALTTAVFSASVPATAANFAVTEMHYNPVAQAGATTAPFNDPGSYEFVELRNIGSLSIDLNGVQFTEGITFDFTTGDVRFLEPGQSVVVVSNLQAFALRYGSSVRVAGAYSGSLSNGGETITLIDATSAIIHSFDYDDDQTTIPAWPATPDGAGPSLTVISVTGDYDSPTNWRASTLANGTPGYDEDHDFVPSVPNGLQTAVTGYTSTSTVVVPIANLLTWSAVPTAVNYRIERKLGVNGTYVEIGSASNTVYSDIGLAAGSTYYYRVRGTNAVGNGPYTTEISVTTPILPSNPTTAQFVTATATAISLRWTDNASNENGFQVFRSNGSGALTLVANVAASISTSPSIVNYTDSGLTPGVTYHYEIRAFNVSGRSELASLDVTTLLPAPNLVFSQRNNNTATLLFTAPAGVTSYKIYRGTASGQETLLASNVTSVPYVDTTLQTGVTYFYYVTAVNGSAAQGPNESVPSNASSPTVSGNVFQWTGAGANNNWTTAGNWLGGAAPTGNANESLVFPTGASRMASVNNYPAGSNFFAGIFAATGGYSFTINNNLALGSAGISVNGTGTQTISAASGSVSIFLAAAETFNVAGGATLVINSAINKSSYTLTVAGAGNVILNGAISGTGGVIISSGGTVTLNGASNYTGATSINSGVVNLASNTALSTTSDITVAQGATVALQGTLTPGSGLLGRYYNVSPDSSRFVDYPTLSTYLSGLTPNLTAISSTTSLNGTFDFNGNGTAFPAPYNSNGSNFVAVYTGVFTAATAGTYTFYTGSDDGSMIYIGGNVVVNNNYFQGVTVRSGTVSLTAGNHDIVIAYYQGGGGYGFYADVQTPGGSLQRIPNSMLSTIASTNVQFGSLSGAGTVQLGGNKITIGGNGHSSTFTGIMTGDIAAGLTKIGAGTIVLSQPQYQGTTTISAGSLQFGDGATPLTSLPTSAITDNGTLIIANPVGTTLTYSKAISGTGGLTTTGGGTLTLTGINPYLGATNISGGVVNAMTSSALGNKSAVTVAVNSTLNFPGQTEPGLYGTYYSTAPSDPNQSQFSSLSALTAYVASLPVLLTDRSSTANNANNNGTVFDYGSNGAGFPATILSNPNQFIAVWTGQFNATVAGSYTFNTGSDDGSMIYINGMPVVINNAFQGVTTRSGTISLTPGYHSIVIAYNQGNGGYGMFANVQVPGGTLQRIPNSLLITNTQIEFGSLAGGGNVNIINPDLNLIVGSNNQNTSFGGILSGAAGLTKVGTGILTLGNSNTYTGNTLLSAGTLSTTASNALGGNTSSTLTAAANTTLNLFNNGSAITTFGTADFTAGNISVNTGAGVLAIKNQLKLSGGTTIAGDFTISGTSIAGADSASTPRTLTTMGGTVTLTTQSGPAAPTNGLLRRYTFDGVATDVSGNNGIGTRTNGAELGTIGGGKYGSGYLDLSASSNAMLTIGTSIANAPNIGTSFTISTWYQNSTDANYRTLTRGLDSNGADHQVMVNSNSNNLGFWGNSSGGGFQQAGTATIPGGTSTGNTWHFIAVVANSTAGTVSYYTNNNGILVLLGTLNKSLVGNYLASIGNHLGGNQRFAQKLDDTWIYNRALSTLELTTVMNNTLLPNSITFSNTNLVIGASTTLDLGTTTTDSFGTLTLTNGANLSIQNGTSLTVRSITATGGSSTISTTGATQLIDTGEIKAMTGTTLTLPAMTLSGTTFNIGAVGANAGTVVFGGANTVSGTNPLVTIVAGAAFVGGTFGGSGTTVNVAANATLEGHNGIVTATTSVAGTLGAGASISGNVTGKLQLPAFSFLTNSKAKFDIRGTTQGSSSNGYDQLVASGVANLNNAILQVSLGSYTPTIPTFTILTRTGTGSITGTFAGLAGGARVTAIDSTQTFIVHYSATAVTLTVPTPTITNLTPNAGVNAGGTTVTITGTGLTGGNITFGGVAASYVSGSDSVVVVTAPAGSGMVDVFVTTAGGSNANTTADNYTFGIAPIAPTVRINATATNPAGSSLLDASQPQTGGLATFSRVINLVLTFNTPVSSVDAAAFTLTNGSVTLTNATAISVSGFGTTFLSLTFPGTFATPGVEYHSLADGIWTLTTDLTKVHSSSGVGSGSGVTNNIRRLYGDANGTGTVDGGDFGLFGSTFGLNAQDPSFNAQFDVNDDGSINGGDFGPFGSRFGTGL